MRSHAAMKASRSDARRALQRLRGGTNTDIRHELVTFDLIDQHRAFHADDDDEA
jgi:hypothetical protein